jgi:hypothetical protein
MRVGLKSVRCAGSPAVQFQCLKILVQLGRADQRGSRKVSAGQHTFEEVFVLELLTTEDRKLFVFFFRLHLLSITVLALLLFCTLQEQCIITYHICWGHMGTSYKSNSIPISNFQFQKHINKHTVKPESNPSIKLKLTIRMMLLCQLILVSPIQSS